MNIRVNKLLNGYISADMIVFRSSVYLGTMTVISVPFNSNKPHKMSATSLQNNQLIPQSMQCYISIIYIYYIIYYTKYILYFSFIFQLKKTIFSIYSLSKLEYCLIDSLMISLLFYSECVWHETCLCLLKAAEEEKSKTFNSTFGLEPG